MDETLDALLILLKGSTSSTERAPQPVLSGFDFQPRLRWSRLVRRVHVGGVVAEVQGARLSKTNQVTLPTLRLRY
jgi:hypothetical protein